MCLFVLVMALFAAKDTTQADYILLKGVEQVSIFTAQEAAERKLKLTGEFHVTSSAFLVQSGGNIYDVLRQGWILKKKHPGLESFTGLGDGILAISKGKLGAFEDGALHEKVKLPTSGMHLLSSSEPDTVYIYGGNKGPNRSIYCLKKGGEYEKVVEADGQILAAAEGGGRLFFSVKDRVYTVKSGEVPAQVFRMPVEDDIVSIAYDSERNLLYFSAGNAIFALQGAGATLVVSGLSGELQFYEDLLFVLDVKRRTLVSLAGIAEALPTQEFQKPSKTPLREGSRND